MTVDQLRDDLGPMLPDGTLLSDLIDTDFREVSLRVLTDPALYQLEMERLFTRAWTIVGHEDEVPNPGDYVTRFIGEDPVIVNRQPAGSINVMLNVCSHRGTKLCRGDAGNFERFQCPYHGWAFDCDGSFLGAPVAKEQMHGNLRPKSELGLRKAKVGIYAGMIFATFDEQAPSLDEYLGESKWYLDLIWRRRESGMTVLGPPQRYVIKANWKCAAEQAAGDNFHAISLHRSIFEMVGIPSGPELLYGAAGASKYGWMHCFDSRAAFARIMQFAGMDVSNAKTPLEVLSIFPPAGMSEDMVPDLAKRFSPEQLWMLAEYRPTVGFLWPNIMIFCFPQPLPDGRLGANISWRVFVPKGPEHFEVFSWFLIERDSSDELKDRVRRAGLNNFGISGLTESDDADVWPFQTEVSRGGIARNRKLRYQAVAGENRPEGWPGPGKVYSPFVRDDISWNFWLRYLEFMSGRPWS